MKKLYLSADNSTWIDSSTYGIYLNSDTYLNAPAFDYTEYSVPARNGNLVAYNNRYGNVIRRFDCYINASVETNFDSFKKWIYTHPGYVYIKSDYDTTTYQKGYLAQDIQVEPFNKDGNYSIQFSLYFSCQPQKIEENSWSKEATAHSFFGTPYERSSRLVKNVLSKLDTTQIPDDMIFLRVPVTTGSYTVNSLSVYWSEGAVFACFFEADADDNVIQVFGSGLNGYTTNVAHTGTSSSTTLDVITGFRDTGTMYLINNGSTMSGNVSLGKEEKTSSSAVGAEFKKITVKMVYKSFVNTTKPSSLILSRYNGNNLLGRGQISFNFGLFDAGSYKDANDNITLEIDTTTLTCYMVAQGLPKVNVGNYINITGEPNGECDKFTIQAMLAGKWQIETATVYSPVWWKL